MVLKMLGVQLGPDCGGGLNRRMDGGQVGGNRRMETDQDEDQDEGKDGNRENGEKARGKEAPAQEPAQARADTPNTNRPIRPNPINPGTAFRWAGNRHELCTVGATNRRKKKHLGPGTGQPGRRRDVLVPESSHPTNQPPPHPPPQPAASFARYVMGHAAPTCTATPAAAHFCTTRTTITTRRPQVFCGVAIPPLPPHTVPDLAVALAAPSRAMESPNPRTPRKKLPWCVPLPKVVLSRRARAPDNPGSHCPATAER